MKNIKYFLLVCLLATVCSPAAIAQITEDVVRVQSARGATVPYLLSRDAGAAPQAIYVLLSGGFGEHTLSQRGTVVQVFNDLRLPARARALFAVDGVAALVDVPSDRNLLSDEFRASEAHSQDLGAVIADLRQRYPVLPVVLVGNSNGTISAAHAAARLGRAIDRVVLISGRFVDHWYAGEALSRFDFGQIKVPLLLVHHVRDGCSVTPYSAAQALGARFPLISVNDGPGIEIGSCTSLGTHGLSGKEAPVVEAIRAWAKGMAWPAMIE